MRISDWSSDVCSSDLPLDRALTAAAERSLAGHDEGIGLEPSAVRLAAALVSARRGGGSTALEAPGDRLLALFLALGADAVGLAYDDARDAELDRDADPLWPMRPALGETGRAACRVRVCPDH